MPRAKGTSGENNCMRVTANCPCDVCPLVGLCSQQELKCPRFDHWAETGKLNEEKSLALPVFEAEI